MNENRNRNRNGKYIVLRINFIKKKSSKLQIYQNEKIFRTWKENQFEFPKNVKKIVLARKKKENGG